MYHITEDGYRSLSSSNQLDQTFAPVSSQGDKLAVAVQIDGDAHGDSYQVYIDRVSFSWK